LGSTLNDRRQTSHDVDVLTVPTKAQAASWFDGATKAVALIGGIFVIVGGCWLAYVLPGGGVRFGTQVETETLAAATKAANDKLADATKAANDVLTNRIAGVDEKATRIETTMAKVVEQLNQLSVIMQRLSDHDRHLKELDDAVKLANDRISNVSQNANDRMNQIAGDAARLQGRLEGASAAPDIRQPRRQ
jgi:uncharacterized phage infection (PIP) family protein YhgE